MGGGTMREAAAQQTQLDTRALEALRGNLVTQLTGIRTQLDTMRQSGIPPVVGYTDANVTALLTTLSTNAAALGIPITGTTPLDRFHSLNNWLNGTWRDRPALTGRNQDSTIDQAVLDELRTRLTIALSAPGATAVATAVAPTVAGPQPAAPTAQPTAPVAVPVPVAPTAVPGPAQPSATATAQPAAPVTATLREQNSGVMYDLEFIAANGRNAQIRARATTLIRELNREFDARRPSQRTIDTKLGQARTLITAELQAANEASTEARRRQYETATGAPHPLASSITALAADSALNTALQQASNGRVRVSDVWLLDDTSMREMVRLLTEAQAAIRGGTSPTDSLTRAATLFTTQQAAYLRMVEIARQTAQAEVTEIHGSSLPTREQLTARERQDGQPAGAYYNLRVPREGRIQRRIPTARSDLEAVAQRRLDAATAMSGQSGRLAYYAVTDLYNDTRSETRNIHYLISLWDYASSHGLSTHREAATFYQNYTAAVALFAAPELNPFRDLYTRDQQMALIRAHLNLPVGVNPTAGQEATARRELTERFMRNLPLKYDYTLFNVFEQVAKLNTTSGATGIPRLASVRTLRVVTEMEYAPYLANVPPVIRDDQGRQLMNAQGEMLSSDELAQLTPTVPHRRFVFVRGMLERAVQSATDSGMGADDRVLVAARAWLTATATEPTTDAARISAADTLYNVTLGLLSIREAELWAANPSFRPGSSASTTTGAAEQITRARAAFLWSFSNQQVGTAYHANMARRLADDATSMLMGPGFSYTEAPGMFFTRAYYGNAPRPSSVPQTATWLPTLNEQIASGQTGEQLYLTFLTSLASGSSAALFSPSAAETTLASAGLAGPTNALGLSVSRETPQFTWTVAPLGEYPDYYPVQRRARPTVAPLDTHALPRTITASPDLGNHGHEDVDKYVHGQTYVEVSRQFYMSVDPGVDPLLHGFEIAPNAYPVRTDAQFRAQDQALKDRLIAIAREYNLPVDRPLIDSLRERMQTTAAAYSTALAGADDATRTRLLGERQQEANRIMLAILDVRIAQLDSRLSGNVMLADGQPIRASDLTRSRDPRKYTVVRAQEMLAEARALRTRFNAALGTDYFGRGGVDPREAIGIAEMGIASLTDSEVRVIERPITPRITAMVPTDAITQDRTTRVNDRSDRETIVTFTATRTMITPQGGSPVTLEEYERTNGRQNLTYYWFMFQDIQPSTGMLLLNPQYRDTTQPRYVGMVQRGVTTTDGRTGDFVVRVRRVDAPSRDLEWAVVAEADGRIRPENILFEMRGGTMDPVRDTRLEANIQSVAFARSSTQQTVVNYGPITPVLIVRPSATNAQPPATTATSRPATPPAQPAAPASSTRKK